jgi:hypothetical protein
MRINYQLIYLYWKPNIVTGVFRVQFGQARPDADHSQVEPLWNIQD